MKKTTKIVKVEPKIVVQIYQGKYRNTERERVLGKKNMVATDMILFRHFIIFGQ